MCGCVCSEASGRKIYSNESDVIAKATSEPVVENAGGVRWLILCAVVSHLGAVDPGGVYPLSAIEP